MWVTHKVVGLTPAWAGTTLPAALLRLVGGAHPRVGGDGNKILPNNSGELFAIKFANGINEVGVMGIQNGPLDCYVIGELQEKPAYRARIDYYPGLVVQGGRAAARLRGIAKS